VNGLPLPAPDEIPPEEPSRPSNLSLAWNPRSSEPNLNKLTVPIGSRSMSQNSERSNNLSASHPAFSLPSPTSPIASNSSSSPFFRGRAKTLASLATGSRNASQTDIAPQELQLPKDPCVNGQRVEVFLYKNILECPICFMYYPPHLNRTRCCDQVICSECFVQIRRPEPHAPEHHGDSESPPAEEAQDEVQLVSEPAACPYCAQPEFGVTYEPPPFRRGLVYHQPGQNPLSSATSAMSSTSSLGSPSVSSPARRRATLLAVTDKTVITTDMVRPDWSKKLADARAHALRRAAAATALHNAAYMMGNIQHESRFVLGRRRRTMFGTDSAGSSGHGTPRRDRDGSTGLEGVNDIFPGRGSSRRGNGNRIDDLEELMIMEAIRLSLAAEEDRKRKEDKDAAREAKKDNKKKAKELKKVAKAQSRVGSGFHPIEIDGLDEAGSGTSSAASKGKAVDRSGRNDGLNPLTEPTSTLNSSSLKDDPQKHLEVSRAQIQRETSGSGSLPPFDPHEEQPPHRSALRNLSNTSSSASSFADSYQNSQRQSSQNNLAEASSREPSPNASGLELTQTDTPPYGTPGLEPMFNFKSLTDAITREEGKDDNTAQHIEHVEDIDEKIAEKSTTQGGGSEIASSDSSQTHELGDSVKTLRPSQPQRAVNEDDDAIEPARRIESGANDHTNLDRKHIGEVSLMDNMRHQHATQ
jgi:hypothetical protein